jgi:FtsH-binding integral membrane protein
MQEYGNFNKGLSGTRDVAAEGFMAKVYLWMALGLAATAVISYYTAASPERLSALFGRGMSVFLVLAVVEIGIVFYVSSRIEKLSVTAASTLFFIYSALNGLTIAPIFLAYTDESIASTFLTTAGMFGVMSVYGTVTKRDLSGWGSFLMMGVIGLLIAGVINIFFASEKTGMVIAIVGVFIFIGLTAYDTQKLRNMAARVSGDDDTAGKYAVLGALALYLDFINMFLYLLRLFGKRR